MLRPPFVIGDPEDASNDLKTKIFKEGKLLYFQIGVGKYVKIGEDEPYSVTFSEREVVNKQASNLSEFDEPEKVADDTAVVVFVNDISNEWSDKAKWIFDGAYWHLFKTNPLKDSYKIPVWIDGKIVSSFDPNAKSSVTFSAPIDAKLFYYGFEDAKNTAPSGFNTKTVKPFSFQKGDVRNAGDLFFEGASSTSSTPPKSPPKKSTPKKSTKQSSSSSEASSSTQTAPQAAPSVTDTVAVGSDGFEVAETEEAAAPIVFNISLLPPPVASTAAKSTLSKAWKMVGNAKVNVRDFAGNLVLHNKNPDTYPFGVKVSMCVDVLRELVLSTAPAMKTFSEFYDATYGVQRWNGRFICKMDAVNNPFDIKDSNVTVSGYATLLTNVPPENAIFSRISRDNPLELELLLKESGDYWIYGILTR